MLNTVSGHRPFSDLRKQLEERSPGAKERIEAAVAASRKAQGLPPKVEDPAALARVADLLGVDEAVKGWYAVEELAAEGGWDDDLM